MNATDLAAAGCVPGVNLEARAAAMNTIGLTVELALPVLRDEFGDRFDETVARRMFSGQARP